MRSADRTGGLVLLLFAGLTIRQAQALEYWPGVAPGPGFLPFWLGVLLAIGALPLLASRGAPERDGRPSRRDVGRLIGVAGCAAAGAALAPLVGLVLVTGLFPLAALSLLAPGRPARNVLAALVIPAVVWLVFVQWLRVPLPRGILGF